MDPFKLLSFQSNENDTGCTSLAVQWLRLGAPNAGSVGSIPGGGTKILKDAGPKIRQ